MYRFLPFTVSINKPIHHLHKWHNSLMLDVYCKVVDVGFFGMSRKTENIKCASANMLGF